MTLEEMDELASEERVENGATWLDEVLPGWEERIDTHSLSMWDGNHCILGQVFHEESGDEPGYNWAWDHFGMKDTDIIARGFAGNGLLLPWIEQVEKRLEAA